MIEHPKNGLTRYQLEKAAKLNPNGVVRLGRFLRLSIDGMSPDQAARLIHWRITRPDYRRR